MKEGTQKGYKETKESVYERESCPAVACVLPFVALLCL